MDVMNLNFIMLIKSFYTLFLHCNTSKQFKINLEIMIFTNVTRERVKNRDIMGTRIEIPRT